MRFELSGFLSLLSVALLVNPTSAVNVSWYTSSTTCSGSSATTYNVPANTCTTHSGAGSAYIWTLPAGSKGQIYSSTGCSSYISETPTSGGGLCAIGKSGTTVRAANWFYPSKKLVRKELESEEPQRFSVTFERRDKTMREVEVPAGEVEKAWKLLLAKDLEALEKYPDFVKA